MTPKLCMPILMHLGQPALLVSLVDTYHSCRAPTAIPERPRPQGQQPEPVQHQPDKAQPSGRDFAELAAQLQAEMAMQDGAETGYDEDLLVVSDEDEELQVGCCKVAWGEGGALHPVLLQEVLQGDEVRFASWQAVGACLRVQDDNGTDCHASCQ